MQRCCHVYGPSEYISTTFLRIDKVAFVKQGFLGSTRLPLREVVNIILAPHLSGIVMKRIELGKDQCNSSAHFRLQTMLFYYNECRLTQLFNKQVTKKM